MKKPSLIARWRIWWGLCPECNSDAPEMDNCPVCLNWNGRNRPIFPPPEKVKDDWRRRVVMARCIHGRVMEDRCPECTAMANQEEPRNPRRA